MNLRIATACALLGTLLVGCAIDRQSNELIAGSVGDQICDLHMVDARNGWAWFYGRNGPRLLLRTMDGAETWQDVTPRESRGAGIESQRGYFHDAKTAWVPIFNKNNFADGLLRTADGGKTWVLLNQTNTPLFGESGDCRFFSSTYGVVSTSDGGLGSAYYTFFDTHDGGKTWSPILLTPRHRESDESPHTFHLSNIGGDRIAFYPPSTTIVTYGDTADEQAKGVLRLSVTIDRGETWRDLNLPLPREYRDRLCVPFEPFFFDKKKVILAARVFKLNADDSYSKGTLIFYTSNNGGITWVAKPGVVELQDQWDPNSFNVVSSKCFIVQNSKNLRITHDGARSWQTITPNISFHEDHRDVVQMDFVDAIHGWIIIFQSQELTAGGGWMLYRTSDGGNTWAKLPLRIFR